jgi:tRNA U34 5-carboxymethylaminomethyl modifying enzyme MnmG/GidA
MPTSHYDFDVLVIGAGHAGAEAVLATAAGHETTEVKWTQLN